MIRLKKFLKKILSPRQIETLKNIQKFYCHHIAGRLNSNNLLRLAMIYGTDKWGGHFYATYYAEHFSKLKNKRIKILEIGVGGYEDPKQGAGSLKMWKRYFPKGMVYSIDIYDKSALEEKRIKIFRGSQADEAFLKKICTDIGPLDIVIDDGSHIVSHVLTSFKTIFPFLNEGGIYVIEDTQSSYWPTYEGNAENLTDPSTSMNFFKGLADGLNFREFLKPGYKPSYFDENIIALHFYHNLIFIYKGKNDEPSNAVDNGRFK